MLPFSVDRHSHRTLTDQLAAGLRRAIETGCFKPGDSLPTMRELAAECGVSIDVVRTAVGRLAGEGLVTARPKRGIEVCGDTRFRWRGHVLYLHWASATSYYEAVLSEAVLQYLVSQRILVTSIHLSGDDTAAGNPQVQAVLKAGAVDLAVVSGSAAYVDAVLAGNGVPFVQMASFWENASPMACRMMTPDFSAAYRQVVRHAADCGVRSMAIVSPPRDGQALATRAARAGIAVTMLPVERRTDHGLPEAVERAGLDALTHWLETMTALPDLLFFSDDYLARGGLTALLAHGIGIPRDVQVITWANRNLGPVFPIPLTRVESDPKRDGKTLAELAIQALKNPDKKTRRPRRYGPEFIVGQTTRTTGAREKAPSALRRQPLPAERVHK